MHFYINCLKCRKYTLQTRPTSIIQQWVFVSNRFSAQPFSKVGMPPCNTFVTCVVNLQIITFAKNNFTLYTGRTGLFKNKYSINCDLSINAGISVSTVTQVFLTLLSRERNTVWGYYGQSVLLLNKECAVLHVKFFDERLSTNKYKHIFPQSENGISID